jgi:hypothetical protein
MKGAVGAGGKAVILPITDVEIIWRYSSAAPYLFRVDGATLALENITCRRDPDDPDKTARVLITVRNNGRLEIRDKAVITNPNGNGIEVEGAHLTMTGGAVTGSDNSVFARGSKSTVAISGGEIISGNNTALLINENSLDCTLTISGGTISGNCDWGVSIGGDRSEVTMSGGTISGFKSGGLLIWKTRAKVTITGTAVISGNEYAGVIYGGTDNGCADCTITMTGGTIRGNGLFGLVVQSPNNSFEKTGGVIYGTSAGADSHEFAAIAVQDKNRGGGYLLWTGNADAGTVFAAKINAAGDGPVPGSLKPQESDWN